jgi:hypothetical protein
MVVVMAGVAALVALMAMQVLAATQPMMDVDVLGDCVERGAGECDR